MGKFPAKDPRTRFSHVASATGCFPTTYFQRSSDAVAAGSEILKSRITVGHQQPNEETSQTSSLLRMHLRSHVDSVCGYRRCADVRSASSYLLSSPYKRIRFSAFHALGLFYGLVGCGYFDFRY